MDRLAFPALLLCVLWGGTARADDAAVGREIYNDTCAGCHGKALVLTNPGLAFDLRKFPPGEPERFRDSVLNGKGKGMPPWKAQLSEDDVKALWDYIKSGG